jgi:hypothetical protein
MCMWPCYTYDEVRRTGDFYAGYCGEKLLGVIQSRRGGVGGVSRYVGEWKCVQGFSVRHKNKRRLGGHRNRREEIKRK